MAVASEKQNAQSSLVVVGCWAMGRGTHTCTHDHVYECVHVQAVLVHLLG